MKHTCPECGQHAGHHQNCPEDTPPDDSEFAPANTQEAELERLRDALSACGEESDIRNVRGIVQRALRENVRSAGEPGSLDVAPGSRSVPSADFLDLAARWEYAASLCRRGDYLSCEQTGARMLRACASDLRRQVELSGSRQPDQNPQADQSTNES